MKLTTFCLLFVTLLSLIQVGCSNALAVSEGTYRLNVSEVSPAIKLNKNATYELIEPDYSSLHTPVTGKYEVLDSSIVLESNGNKFSFYISENSLIYDKEHSSTDALFQKYDILENKSEFVKTNE